MSECNCPAKLCPPGTKHREYCQANDTPKLWVAADTQAWLRLPADQRYGPVLAYTKRSDKHCVPLYFNEQSDTSAPPAQPSKVVAALRKFCIKPVGGFFDRRGCLQCDSSWAKEAPEQHVPGCLAELGEGRSHAAFDKYGEWKDRP